VQGRIEIHAGLYWGNLKETNHLEYLVIDGKYILIWLLKIYGRRM
jgi:hypothetical protein